MYKNDIRTLLPLSTKINFLIVGLLMSSFATELFHIIGIPTMPELVTLPILYRHRKYFQFERAFAVKFNNLILFTLLLLICALINAQFSISAILSTARAYFLMGLFFIYGTILKRDKIVYEIINIILIGSLVGWFIVNIGKFFGIFQMGDDMVTYGNMLAISTLTAITLMSEKKAWVVILTLLAILFVALTSATRRTLFVIVLSFGLSYIFNIFRDRSIKRQVPVILFICLLIYSFVRIDSYIEENYPILYRRVFIKTTEFFSSDASMTEDETRQDNFKVISDNLFNLLLPRGFVSLRTNEQGWLGIFIDSPLYQLCYTFGLVPIFLFFISYIGKITKLVIKYVKTRDLEIGIYLVPAISVLLLVLLDSTFICWSYAAPTTGFVLGSVYYFVKRIN